MASRLSAGAFYDCFRQKFPCSGANTRRAEDFTAAVSSFCGQVLTYCKPPVAGGAPQIKGSMVRTLPTTAAAALIQPAEDGRYDISPIWAGDSRVYLLTEQGLAQLTVDDTSVPDPMENLYEDGVLKNVLCEGKSIRLHSSLLRVEAPFCVFAATDGCFGYLPTPMEFEGILLETLFSAKSVAEWERLLSERIRRVAGDDYTLCMAAFGYRSFPNLQQSFSARFRFLQENYLRRLYELPLADRETRRMLWQRYQQQYLQYIKGA